MAVRQAKFLALICCSITLMSLLPIPAAGQGETVLRLTEIDISAFPQVTAYLDVHSASGSFVDNLTFDQLRIIEAGQPLTASHIAVKKTGVQFVIAITLGPAMGIRDGQGVNRLDYVLQGVKGWQSEIDSAAPDDYSLITTAGPEIIHQSDTAALLKALASYQPNARDAAPSLQILSRALQIAEDAPPLPGMEKAVLFITPLHSVNAAAGMQSLANQARQTGIRIYVWLVASPELSGTVESFELQNLAADTGGELFTFTGTESIPDIELYLRELRSIYKLSYTSMLRKSGSYPVSIEATIDGMQAISPEATIQLDLIPPTPIFISPPVEIVRKYTVTEITASSSPFKETVSKYVPEMQPLKILTEPSSGNRGLIQSVLYVDDNPVAINSSPPFDQFNWDLTAYSQSGTHILRVEVVDNLGLSGVSADIPVKITVEEPALSVKMVLNSRGYLLAGVALVVAGLILVLVLIAAGRISPNPQSRKRSRAQNSRHSQHSDAHPRSAKSDPVTQPVAALSQAPVSKIPRWAHRIKWPQRHSTIKAKAFLTPLSDPGEDEPETPIPITADEIIFGRNMQASWIIEDPSLDDIHARLIREGAAYRIVDNGTIAGTWVNYEHTPPDGTILKNGDLVHLGRIRFRFTNQEPGQARKILIQPQEFYP